MFFVLRISTLHWFGGQFAGGTRGRQHATCKVGARQSRGLGVKPLRLRIGAVRMKKSLEVSNGSQDTFSCELATASHDVPAPI